MKLSREKKAEIVKVHCKKLDLNFDEKDSPPRPILRTFKHLFKIINSTQLNNYNDVLPKKKG